MEHTPGSWRPIPYSSVVGAGVAAQPNPKENSIVLAMIPGADRDTANANARLMAAAPELLEALEGMVDSAKNHRIPLTGRARAVIAKVKEE